MTARQFFQRYRIVLFVVAGLLLVYSNGSYLSEVSGVPFVGTPGPLNALTDVAGIVVRDVFAPFDPLTRAASDHLPLVDDLRLTY